MNSPIAVRAGSLVRTAEVVDKPRIVAAASEVPGRFRYSSLVMARFLELAFAACILAIFCETAQAAAEAELKDSAGRNIIRYVVEPPDSISGPTSDPAS